MSQYQSKRQVRQLRIVPSTSRDRNSQLDYQTPNHVLKSSCAAATSSMNYTPHFNQQSASQRSSVEIKTPGFFSHQKTTVMDAIMNSTPEFKQQNIVQSSIIKTQLQQLYKPATVVQRKLRRNIFKVEPSNSTKLRHNVHQSTINHHDHHQNAHLTIQKQLQNQQQQRGMVKVSSVGLVKRGMLSLNSQTSPENNYLPHTAKPGDRGGSWGTNRVQHVLNQQINIFTPTHNRNYLNMLPENTLNCPNSNKNYIAHSNSTGTLTRKGPTTHNQLSPDMQQSLNADQIVLSQPSYMEAINKSPIDQSGDQFFDRSRTLHFPDNSSQDAELNQQIDQMKRGEPIMPIIQTVTIKAGDPFTELEQVIEHSASMIELPQMDTVHFIESPTMQSQKVQQKIVLDQVANEEYFVDVNEKIYESGHTLNTVSEHSSPFQTILRKDYHNNKQFDNLPINSLGKTNGSQPKMEIRAEVMTNRHSVMDQQHQVNPILSNAERQVSKRIMSGQTNIGQAASHFATLNQLISNPKQRMASVAVSNPFQATNQLDSAVSVHQILSGRENREISEPDLPDFAKSIMSPAKNSKSRQEPEGLIPVSKRDKMTPGHQMMLLHSSASQGQSSAVFYGGGQGGNMNDSKDYTDLQRNQTSRSLREEVIASEILDGQGHGNVLTELSPHQLKEMPESVEETIQRNFTLGKESMATSVEQIDLMGQNIYTGAGLTERQDDDQEQFVNQQQKASQLRQSVKKQQRGSIKHKRNNKLTNRKKKTTQDELVQQRQGEVVCLGVKSQDDNPISIHNLIKNRTKRYGANHQSYPPEQTNQVAIDDVDSLPFVLANPNHMLSKCNSTEYLPSHEIRSMINQPEQLDYYGKSTVFSHDMPSLTSPRSTGNIIKQQKVSTENNTPESVGVIAKVNNNFKLPVFNQMPQLDQSSGEGSSLHNHQDKNASLVKLLNTSCFNSTVDRGTAAETMRETINQSSDAEVVAVFPKNQNTLQEPIDYFKEKQDINIVQQALYDAATFSNLASHRSREKRSQNDISNETDNNAGLNIQTFADNKEDDLRKQDTSEMTSQAAISPPAKIFLLERNTSPQQKMNHQKLQHAQQTRANPHFALSVSQTQPVLASQKDFIRQIKTQKTKMEEDSHDQNFKRSSIQMQQQVYSKAVSKFMLAQQNQNQNSMQRMYKSLNMNKNTSSLVSRAQNPTQLKLQKKLADGVVYVAHSKQSVGFIEQPPSESINQGARGLSKNNMQSQQALGSEFQLHAINVLRNDLKDDFFDSMDEVTYQRETKIKCEMKEDKIRIKQFKDSLKKQHESVDSKQLKLRRGQQQQQQSTDQNHNKSSPRKMNEYVHLQMQMGPKSGKLSRTSTNPYNNVILKPFKDSPTARVKQSTLHNMRSNFESSVGISNFNDPNADDQQLLIDDHQNANKRSTKIISDGDASGEATGKQKWASVPMTKPLNLREIKNVGIHEILLREQCSCQHYSIVSTPKAVRQGALFNIEREEKVFKKRQEKIDTFQYQRQLVTAETSMKWQAVKDEYCQDFDMEKQEARRFQVKQNFRKFIQNFLEQYEILTQKMKISPNYMREYSLFPMEAFAKGEIVKSFLRLVKAGDLLLVNRLLKQDPELVFQYDEMNQSGLIWAAKRNNALMVRMLLKAHSRVNYRDLAGRTALTFAVQNDNEEMVRFLLCFKANPCVEDNKGQTIMNWYDSKEKKTNLKIGSHMKLCIHQLFRQEFLVEFVYKVHLAAAQKNAKENDSNHLQTMNSIDDNVAEGTHASQSQAAPGWTRRELRDRAWKSEVLDHLDPYDTIKETELPSY